jgi:drug/metabolite transporter (DMT)-like permease
MVSHTSEGLCVNVNRNSPQVNTCGCACRARGSLEFSRPHRILTVEFSMKKINVYVLLALQQLISGGTHIVAKVVVADVDPAAVTFLRSIIASAGLLAVFWSRSGPLRIERKDWGRVALMGFLGVSLNQFLYLYGLRYTTAANGALLYAATPVFVLLLSHLFLKETISLRKAIGIALAFVGIAIVIFERGVDLGSAYALGNLLILVAVIGWTLAMIVGKGLIVRYGALQTTTAMMAAGAVIFAPFGLVATIQVPFPALGLFDWAGILYLALGTSILGYLLWYHALGRIDASKVAVFANGQPVIAAILSLVFLDYAITGNFVMGSIITISGIVVTQRG